MTEIVTQSTKEAWQDPPKQNKQNQQQAYFFNVTSPQKGS